MRYRIPKRYYIDHVIDCEAPEVLHQTKQHYYISAEETDDMAEFRSRCIFYAEGWADCCPNEIIASAKATLKVIGILEGEDHPVVDFDVPIRSKTNEPV